MATIRKKKREIEDFEINWLAYGFEFLQHHAVGRVAFQVLIGAVTPEVVI